MTPFITKQGIKAVHKSVDFLFDRLIARMLGPQYVANRGNKNIYIGYKPQLSIPGLYMAAAEQEQVKPQMGPLDSLAEIARGYLEAQRTVAKSRVVKAVDSFIREADASGVDTDVKTVLGGELADLWGKTTHEVSRIIDTESTGARNLGVLEGITVVNANAGVEDPVCFFIIVRDENCCQECIKLHLLDDKITPRCWYLSEVGHGYHKKGEGFPALGGEHPHCFVGDTRISTSFGQLTIQELYTLNRPLSVVVDSRVKNRKAGNNQYGAEIPGSYWLDRHDSGSKMLPATPVFDTGIRPCIKIVLSTGHEVEVSEEHEMWVDDNKAGVRVKAMEVKVGDKIPVLSGEGAFGFDHFPAEAELMGSLMRDGCINSKSVDWHFFGDDLPYGEKLSALAADCGAERHTELTTHQPNNKYNVMSSSFSSMILRRRFVEEFGLSKKPRRVPVRLWSADKETVASFLRGLYAADGHSEGGLASGCRVISLCQNDREFLLEIQQLLGNFGLVARMHTHGTETVHKMITYADGRQFDTIRKPCWRLIIGGIRQCKLFASTIGMGVPAKQAKLLHFISLCDGKKEHGSWRTAKVISVEKTGDKQTYCLTEPMTNTVTANNIVTGQCRCSVSTLMPGWGFNSSGMITYIAPGHNEIKRQRGEE